LTETELENYNKKIIKICPSCDSKNVNVRAAKENLFYVGCMDCSNKTLCEEKYIDYAIEKRNEYVRRCGKW
jgi:hypothetical protein